MRSLKQALNDFVKRAEIDKPIAQGSALSMWDETVGSKIRKNTEATTIESGVLTVKSTNAVWRQELQLEKRKMIEKLNKKIGKEIVKDIRFLWVKT